MTLTNSPSLKAWTRSPVKGLPLKVQVNSGIGLPLTGVVMRNFWPSSTATSPMGLPKDGADLGFKSDSVTNYRPGQPNWEYTKWKFQDFSPTQILREINFGRARSSKNAIFAISEALNF